MTLYDDLIANPFAARRYLAILEPYDPDLNAVVALYLSDHGFTTEPDDIPANRHFDARLLSGIGFERHMFRGGENGSRSSPGFGTLDVNNADGGLDHWRRLAFDGRRIRLLLGGDGFRFTDHRTVFDGTAEQIEFDDDRVRVRLRDLQVLFDRPLQQTLYEGTGGTEGGPELTGRPKPLCYGRCFHIPAVLIDPATLTYQVHDGPIAGIDAVFVSGLALTAGGDPPGPSEYLANLPAGTFRLGSGPAGIVTAHVRGDASGAYAEDTASLILRIAQRTGLTAIDWTAFSALTAAAPAATGFFAATEVEMARALDRLAASVGAHHGFDRAGTFTVGRLAAPASNAVERFDESAIVTLEREPTPLPIWRQSLGYRPYWRPLTESESAGGVPAATRKDLSETYRRTSSSNPDVLTRHLLAGDRSDDTLIAEAADAATEVARRVALFGVARDLFRVRGKTRPHSLALGESVEIVYPRHGLENGRSLVLVGLSEDSALDEADLTLWG